MKTSLSNKEKNNSKLQKAVLLIVLLFFITRSFSQIITLLDEDFEGNSIPNGWQEYNYWGQGSQPWTFGSPTMPGNGVQVVDNFPNNAAIFNDDASGNTGLNDSRVLYSPVIDGFSGGLYEKANIKLRYQYALNNLGDYNDKLHSEILSNVHVTLAWHLETTNPVYQWVNLTEVFETYSTDLDPSTFIIGWYFDDVDASWGWGAGIDDVAVMVNPDNDNCLDAFVVDALPYNIYTNAIGATNYPDFVTCGSYGMNDGVWYTFTPTQYGYIQIELANLGVSNGFPWDAAIGLYSGSCGNFSCVGMSDFHVAGDNEYMTVPVEAGVNYYLNIGYFDANVNEQEGLYELTITGDDIFLATPAHEIIGFEMYPNPTTDILNLKAPTLLDQVEVYNMLGQKVLQNTLDTAQAQIDVSTLSQGSYILKVQAGNQMGAYHFIKE
jgi:hypothetical protein